MEKDFGQMNLDMHCLTLNQYPNSGPSQSQNSIQIMRLFY